MIVESTGDVKVEDITAGSGNTFKIPLPNVPRDHVCILTAISGEISEEGGFGPVYCILQIRDVDASFISQILDEAVLRRSSAAVPYYNFHAFWTGRLPLPQRAKMVEAIGHFANDTSADVECRLSASWTVEKTHD